MSAALGLLRLQQVDSRIDQLGDKLERIRVELENDAEIAAARKALEVAEAAYADAERERLAAENLAKSQRLKMQRAESTLYGGGVRNPKELQDLQADVASLKKHLTALDESELRWMEKLEAAEQDRRHTSEKLAQVLSAASAAQGLLMDQQAELKRTRAQLQAERDAAVGAVDPHLLESYETLRRTRRGIAVAEVSDGACGACGTVLTAALQQNARHATDLVHCPSCGRILFGG
jgi:predicted  nucleic acid-binding Zn-ribbon protein